MWGWTKFISAVVIGFSLGYNWTYLSTTTPVKWVNDAHKTYNETYDAVDKWRKSWESDKSETAVRFKVEDTKKVTFAYRKVNGGQLVVNDGAGSTFQC